MAFLGGSAYAMARDVGEGFVLLNPVMMKRMNEDELKQLRFEMERLLTAIRAESYPAEDNSAVQNRNRRISRLNSAVTMVHNFMMARR